MVACTHHHKMLSIQKKMTARRPQGGSQAAACNVLVVACCGLAVIVGLYEFVHQMCRQHQRKKLFRLAQQASARTRKPLIVVGDPHGGGGSSLWGATYTGGDYCIDLTGCPQETTAVQMKGDVTAMLRTLGDNFGVIFVSCVLEYVDDIESCLAELERVSGGSDLFVVTVSPYCLTAWVYGKLWRERNDSSQAKRLFYSAPPAGKFRWREIARRSSAANS
tara:strand:- start:233 stop:892 length:660 start_codon:yes stop_codon:yes gene_type:complete